MRVVRRNLRFLLLTFAFSGSVAAETVRRPNIIWIVSDDHGYADVGYHRARRDLPTPHLDELAKQGVRFSQAYVAAAVCSPSRAGFITGKYPQRFGHETNPAFRDSDAGLPTTERTIADRLREVGYVTGGIGKWHLGKAPRFHPLRRGFQEWYGFPGGGHRYLGWSVDDTKEYLTAIERDGQPVSPQPTEYLTDVFSREAAAFVERHHDRPFFLYLAYNAPHTPLEAPTRYLDRVRDIEDEARRTYAAMVCAIDDGIGQLRAKLRQLGLERDTMVVFFSDNGGPIAGSSANGSSNAPLRGGKSTFWEGGIRVPLIMAWPAALEAGQVFRAPISTLDLLPTALAAAGHNPAHDVDGVDLLPFLRHERVDVPHASLFWRHYFQKRWAVRAGDWKLLFEDGRERLFDLAADPAEQNDLAAGEPARRERLRTLYEQWDARNVKPAFGPLR